MLAHMKANGVAAAIATGRTRFDAASNYLEESAKRFPGHFAGVGSIDPDLPDLDERIRLWRSRPAMLGLRVVVLSAEQIAYWERGSYRRVFAAAERHSVPVCIWTPRRLHELLPVVKAYPNLRFVIDHLGLPHTTNACVRDDMPFQRLPDLLAFAELPNAAVKLTGVPSLSREPFPHADVWPAVHTILAAFGLERVMWGSNWRESNPYSETIAWIRDTSELSAADKVLILGATLRKVFDWPQRGSATN